MQNAMPLRKLLRSILAVSLFVLLACPVVAAPPTVVIFIIDGLPPGPATVAVANGATNIKFLKDNGVWVAEARCTSPAPYLRMPDGSLPWGTSTSSNVSMHTGTHVFESRQTDDLFLAAKRAGIKSMFAGGAGNYNVFTTATYLHYSGSYSDARVVDFAVQHITNDGVRLVRLHLQRIRDAWTGPKASTDPASAYQKAIRVADQQLGRLINTLKSRGLWNDTFVILAADHGMGQSSGSGHPPHDRSSWQPVMCFYGPGLKRNVTIPYAETPDIAIMAARFLGIGPLRGHTDPAVDIPRKGPTGTVLTNLYQGQPTTLAHPQYIRRYLVARNWAPPDEYTDYRAYMLSVIR